METTSLTFFVLVAVSLLIYWNCPKRFQWIVLLLDSVVFYFANATCYTFIYVCISIVSVFAATRFFAKAGNEESAQRRKKRVLAIALAVNIGILSVLKYTNLAIHTFNILGRQILHIEGISDVTWLAPLAISFYTLQLVSYLLDCYWGVADPFENPLHLALYTLYFPLMTSGPICRYSQLGRQLFEEHRFDYDRVKFGLYRIAWGMLKKCAIANRMAVIVDQMWAAPQLSTGLGVWVSTGLFLFQLYADFSGCMDIALGVSASFGIALPENFNAPFYSRSMQEFWRRWHITLGTWLKDYVMNPILKSSGFICLGERCKKRFGKKQGKKIPSYLAMLVLWLCMGLWHGSSWKYIVGEGLWFWLIIVIGQICEPLSKKVLAALRIQKDRAVWHGFQTVRTLFLWLFGMVFFRADSLTDAIKRIAAGCHIQLDLHFAKTVMDVVDFSGIGGKSGLLLMMIAMLAVLIVDYLKSKDVRVMETISRLKWRWMLYYAIVIVIYLSLNIASQESIYAQF